MLIKFDKKAKKTLEKVNVRDFERLKRALKDLEENGLASSGVKHLSGLKNAYRKRVGRWRIVFLCTNDLIEVHFIEMEKDTKKDYDRWGNYLRDKIVEFSRRN